jgi:hypothetical protein
LLEIINRTGAGEEFPLELRWNSIPTHDHGSAQAPQNLPFYLRKGGAVAAVLFR